MKTYDETAESILDRRKEYRNKKKRRGSLLALLLIVCIASSTAAGFFITREKNAKIEKEDTPISEKRGVSQKKSDSGSADSVNSELSEIANQSTALSDRYFLLLRYDGRDYALRDRIDEKFADRYIGHTAHGYGDKNGYSDINGGNLNAEELSCDVGGEIFTVKGFDPDFTLCVKSEVNGKYYAFFTFDFKEDAEIDTGADMLGEKAFNLKSFIDSAEYQSHSDWDKAIRIYRKLDGIEKEDLEKLIDCVSAAEAIPPDKSYDEILSDNPVQRHIILNLSGEWPFRMVTLSLFEGGYVRFDTLSAPGTLFKVTDPVFDKIFDAAKDVSASVKELQENGINTDSTQ